MRTTVARLLARPTVAPETLLCLVAAYFVAVCNAPFWRALLAGRPPTVATFGFALAVGVACAALTFALMAIATPRALLRPILTVLLLVTAAAAYFTGTYGVILDPTMIRNVLHTDYREAHEFVGAGLAFAQLEYAALPIGFVWWVRVRRRPALRATVRRLAWIATAVLVAAAALLPVYRDFASVMRNHRALRYLIAPGNYVISLGRTLGEDARAAAQPRIPVGEDAQLGPSWTSSPRPVLFVMIVGETVRADHLSLNGYRRATTPELERLGVINFPEVRSCGTATEASLPCMFSRLGREHYDEGRIRREQGLLNVLATAGLPVLWRDNQSGCKGVCDGRGIVVQEARQLRVPALCGADSCYDEVLLDGLSNALPSDGRSQVVVLHQLGNHGPAYSNRYPARFRRFAPSCDTPELRNCTREAIVNSYDNAIAYTDHFIARTIAFLEARSDRFDTALLYVSDHGESLGEHGLYLHGMPYLIAPREQTRVPMLMWMSPGFAGDRQLDASCLRRAANRPASHDDLFHTVLGLLDVHTSAYRAEHDLSAACRGTSKLAVRRRATGDPGPGVGS